MSESISTNKYIVISPWSKQLRDGSYNPKNYPWWKEVIKGLEKDYSITQIGVKNEEKLVENFLPDLPLREISKLLLHPDCHTWISVDNFLPHLAHIIKKPGIVLWGISDPNIFGYKENKNLLKSRKFLRNEQFQIWDGLKYNPDVFVSPDMVIKAAKSN